jgi:glycosyltransferase involved in cell wall biosynthesis
MKICLIAPVPPFRGGIAKYCYSLAQELEKRHDLLLLSYERQYPALLFGSKSQVDPNVDRVRIKKGFRHLSYDIDSANPFSWRRTAQKIADFNPDTVIFPWWVTYWAPFYTYLLSSLNKKGINVLFLCINVFDHEDNALKKSATKFILRRVDSIIVHSEQEKRALLELNPKAVVKKHLLPLFEYEATATERHDNSTLHLLFFGFVRPYKGLDILLDAIGILKDHDISLKIAGEFWHDKDDYLALIDGLDISDKVEIIDRYVSDDEMSQYFSLSDLVVLPYKKSITSGIIATAYGFKKPVLATNVGGFSEVIQDGCTGRIVAPDDPQALADGIVWFLKNKQINFAENISAFAAQKMSWSSLADMIEAFDER